MGAIPTPNHRCFGSHTRTACSPLQELVYLDRAPKQEFQYGQQARLVAQSTITTQICGLAKGRQIEQLGGKIVNLTKLH